MTIHAASSAPAPFRRSKYWGTAILGVLLTAVVIRIATPSGPTSLARATSENLTAFDAQTAATQTAQVERELAAAVRRGAGGTAAVEQARSLVREFPRYAPAHALLSRALALAGQPQVAYTEAMASLRLDGRDAQTLALAGRLALQLNMVEPALQHYADAVDRDATRPEYRFGLAQAYLEHRDRDRARRETLDGLKAAPDAHEGYALLSELFAQENKVSMALEKIEKAITLTPRDQPTIVTGYTRREAALLRRDNRPQESLATLQRLGGAKDASPEVLEDQAVCLAMLGQRSQAVELFATAAKLRPNEPALRAGVERWRHKADVQR